MFLFLFFFASPPRWVYLPFWPCILSFWRFVGVPFWAPGVLAFLGFSRYCGGLEITRPLLRPFLGHEAASVFVVDFLFSYVVFPLLCCLRLHFLLGPSRRPTPKWARQRVVAPAPRESDPQGKHFLRGGV